MSTEPESSSAALAAWEPGPARVLPLHEGVRSLSFAALLLVQACTAFNDHTFRWLAVAIAKPLLGDAAALSIGLAGFTLPFLVLATPAGYLADRYSKAAIISRCKLIELALFVFGFLAIFSQSPALLFLAIASTGVLAALFTPSKLGAIPELVPDSHLATANGWMGLMNVAPCALGFLAGNWLSETIQPNATGAVSLVQLAPAAGLVMAVAGLAYGASLGIRRLPPAAPDRPAPQRIVRETIEHLRELADQPVLTKTALGIAFFWMLASLAMINIDTFGIHDLGLNQTDIGVLGMVLVLGVGAGSLLAGWWSAGRIELGLVPLGALGIILCSWLLFLAGRWGDVAPAWAFYGSCVALFGLGTSAGLFDVPLEAFLQYRSPPERLGTILGATNFLVFAGTLVISGVFFVLNGVLGVSAATIFLLAGLGTVPVAIYIVWQLPATVIRCLFWLFSVLVYRLRVYGRANIPKEGGVLLVPNHVTWVDGILLCACAPRPVRFIIYADFVHHPRLAWLAKIFEVIPIKADGGPKALIQSLKMAREAIEAGSCVCIFAEGTLTRTGQMQRFQPGFLKIIQGTGAPVVPTYLHGLWGSIFSFRGGKFFWKWPRQWPYPVTIEFGEPIAAPETVDEVFTAVRILGNEAVKRNEDRDLSPARMFLRACRRRRRVSKVADSSGVDLTGGKLLAASLAFRRVLHRKLAADEHRVGIFLPPTVGCALANLAATLDRRVTVNLNYTMSEADLRFCVQEAGLKTIITSQKMLEKKPCELGAQWLFLEDLKTQITTADRIHAGLGTYVWPVWLLERLLGLTAISLQDLMTIIFTSGSTGEPKGVMLSHQNLRANVDAADQLFQIEPTDVVLGVVPIFHSLGYMATLWLPMCLDPKVVYHINPLDARQIGELAQQHGATILFATPTFLRTYLKRCEKEQFSKLNLVVVGAEKLAPELAEQFQEKFGVLPTEGYGATETTGPACVNVPDHRCAMTSQVGTKLGTVGRPMPGVIVQVVHPETKAPVSSGTEGALRIKGPNVMLGYLNRPEKTQAVLQEGWYDTGDMASVDLDGFVKITGRLSRFSKIGGEMVPHIRLEEALTAIVDAAQPPTGGQPTEGAALWLAVTSVPDAKKGERIIVVHRPLPLPVNQLLAQLAETGLPNLWLPGADGFLEVPEVPLLGTGKLDLKQVKAIALERCQS